MNIRKLSVEEAQALYALGVPLLHKFPDEIDAMFRKHSDTDLSPEEDRKVYKASAWWEYAVVVDVDSVT